MLDVKDENCYIAGEIDSSEVDSDGYLFYVGDGKTYGEYINHPLKPNQEYGVQIVFTFTSEVINTCHLNI